MTLNERRIYGGYAKRQTAYALAVNKHFGPDQKAVTSDWNRTRCTEFESKIDFAVEIEEHGFYH